LLFAYRQNSKIGTGRETFFVNQVGQNHILNISKKGDFTINEKYYIEVGGKNKTFEQIKDIENSFVVADDLEIGQNNKIPLWLFGFLY